MVQIEIGDPEVAMRMLDRLKVTDYGTQVPMAGVVYAWKQHLREKLEKSLEESQLEWRVIPNYKYFEINQKGDVRNFLTKAEVEVQTGKGLLDRVLIHDDRGQDSLAFLEDLIEMAFPTPKPVTEEDFVMNEPYKRPVDIDFNKTYTLREVRPGEDFPFTWWRTVPGFSEYEFSNKGVLRYKETERLVNPALNIETSYWLEHVDGTTKLYSVNDLFDITFPEIKRG